jgi:hypothetical protein
MASGSMPSRQVSRPKVTATCQRPPAARRAPGGASGWEAGPAAASPGGRLQALHQGRARPRRWCRRRPCGRPPSTRLRIWSLHCSSSVPSAGVSRSSPAAHAVQQGLDVVREADQVSSPKMPAEPLTVCAQRNSAPSSSRSSGAVSSCSSSCSMLVHLFARLAHEDRQGLGDEAAGRGRCSSPSPRRSTPCSHSDRPSRRQPSVRAARWARPAAGHDCRRQALAQRHQHLQSGRIDLRHGAGVDRHGRSIVVPAPGLRAARSSQLGSRSPTV